MATLQRRYDHKNLARELSSNRTDALEILREALANAKDHGAKRVFIRSWRDPATTRISLLIVDDGDGLDDGRFESFMGIGATDKRGGPPGRKIGHKGHGTKLFLECRRLTVASRAGDESSWRYTTATDPLQHDHPTFDVEPLSPEHPAFADLRELGLLGHTGTLIRMEQLECPDAGTLLRRRAIESYLDWFTVQADIRAGLFDRRADFHAAIKERDGALFTLLLDHETPLRPLDVRLRINGEAAYTNISATGPFLAAWRLDEGPLAAFGHRFADTNLSQAGKVRGLVDDSSAIRLTGAEGWHSDDGIAIVAHVEGNARQRLTYDEAKAAHKPVYTFEERWGLWLCKDFVPIAQHNALLSRALSASAPKVGYEFKKLRNWKVFVNDPTLQLTANRTAVANVAQREQEIVEALTRLLTEAVKGHAFREWIRKLQDAKSARSKEHEVADADERRDEIKKWLNRKRRTEINPFAATGLSPYPKGYGLTMPEPESEQELVLLYGILTGRYRVPLEVMSYQAHKGIDAIGLCHDRALFAGTIARIEFKLAIEAKLPIDHYFAAIDVLICWRVDSVGPIWEVTSASHGELRRRPRPQLASHLDTHEIVHELDGQKRTIPVLEVRVLFQDRTRA